MPLTSTRALPALLAALILLLAGCGSRHEFTGLILDDPEPAPNIAGTEHTGQPFRLSDYSGEMTLIFFGYTYCPDVCPMTLADISSAQRQIAEEEPQLVEELNVVFVTVDPERDTPERLAEYVPNFNETFHGVYVPPEELEQVKSGYGVYGAINNAGDESNSDYLVDHTSAIFLVDRQGNLGALFNQDVSTSALAADLKALLKR